MTLIEILVVVALLGALALLAAPSMSRIFAAQDLKDRALSVATMVNYARSQAILTGNNHLVFYGTDALGATLVDGASNPVPLLVLDDGRPGDANQNCQIDGGETIRTLDADSEFSAGVTGATGQVPGDQGNGSYAGGSSFTLPNGTTDARWVMFRPEGTPLAFDSACAQGAIGSGAGAFYLTNGERSAAIVVTPTGNTRVHSYAAAWSD